MDFEKRWQEGISSFLAGTTKFGHSKTLRKLELRRAFEESTFIYGTVGPNALHNQNGNTGNSVAKAAMLWAVKTQESDHGIRMAARQLNLYDPGPRTGELIRMGHQMMDMYYGMDNQLFLNRDVRIAEFVHYVMRFDQLGGKPKFDPQVSGRDAFKAAFPNTDEGWKQSAETDAIYGQSATKEMSKIIRRGIFEFGGKLIFEGKAVFGAGIFDPKAYQGDTDLEAQSLLATPGLSSSANVRYGEGTLEFQWGGKPTVPTKAHFLTNWVYDPSKVTHKLANRGSGSVWQQLAQKVMSNSHGLRPIWDQFEDFPKEMKNGTGLEKLERAIKYLTLILEATSQPPRVGKFRRPN